MTQNVRKHYNICSNSIRGTLGIWRSLRKMGLHFGSTIVHLPRQNLAGKF